MKRFLLIIIAVTVLLAGTPAGAFDRLYWREFSSRSYVYESWGHFWFSVWGYRNPTMKDAYRSLDEHWWGDRIVVEK